MAKQRTPKTPTANVVSQVRTGKAPSAGPRRSRGRAVWENVKSLAGTILIYLVVKTLLIEAFRIPSGSMIPSLLIGDWLFVNKLAYGPHIPFTETKLPGYRTPTRGDIVVFRSPYQPDEVAEGRDGTPTLVKRLVAVSGDTIFMRDGMLHVNGLPQRQGFGAEKNWKGDPNEQHPLFEWQRSAEIKGSRFGNPPATLTHDAWGPLIVPAGHYFMMGDNRYCSKDGRYWGPVPERNLRGRPLFVYFSYRPGRPPAPCEGDVSTRFMPAITDIRWARIGDWIR